MGVDNLLNVSYILGKFDIQHINGSVRIGTTGRGIRLQVALVAANSCSLEMAEPRNRGADHRRFTDII